MKTVECFVQPCENKLKSQADVPHYWCPEHKPEWRFSARAHGVVPWHVIKYRLDEVMRSFDRRRGATRGFRPAERPGYIKTSERSWCYICGTVHPWTVACPPVERSRVAGPYAVREGQKR